MVPGLTICRSNQEACIRFLVDCKHATTLALGCPQPEFRNAMPPCPCHCLLPLCVAVPRFPWERRWTLLRLADR